jgi:hypothetical protein
MKAKVQGLTKSDEYKQVIIKELEFVLQKMNESDTVDNKIYYFSAIQGMLHRVMNLEYTDDLLFSFFVTNETHKSFQQRIIGLKTGETVIKLTERQLARLIEITKDFLEAIRKGDNLDAVLKQYVILSYTTTGNGYYLMEKGVLKI